jgi:hypothetical protein
VQLPLHQRDEPLEGTFIPPSPRLQ